MLLACAAFALVAWGGVVTATGSGMAFRDWLTSDGHLMPLYPWLGSAGDKFIEHGHRLLGMATGIVTIALVASLWRCESRRWVRACGVGLLAAVIVQGVLGGQRVLLNDRAPDQARLIALVHGCTGPLFFAAAAAMAVVTSRRWMEGAAAGSSNAAPSSKLLRLAVLTAALAYLQLVVGAVVRHSPLLLAERAGAVFQVAVYFHVLLAFAVTFHVIWLAARCWRGGVCPRPALLLAGLIAVQLLLGMSSWMVKYGMPSWAIQLIGETGHFNRASDLPSAVILAGHGAVGALIFAVATAIALRVGRALGANALPQATVASRLAGGVA
jgi:cytochrome c oxidase assembly protein subunit 15